MVNENETPPRAERPVGPPTIEGQAEEVGESEEAITDALAKDEPRAPAEEKSIQDKTTTPDWEPTARGAERWISAPLIMAALALVIAVVGILAVAGLIDFGTLAQREQMEPRLASVEAASRNIGQRIDELTVAINRLSEQRQEAAPSTPAQDGASAEQMQKLEAQVLNLSSALESMSASLKSIETLQISQQEETRNTANLVSELSSRATTEPPQSQPALQGAAQTASKEVAGALLRLRRAVQEGRPFAQDLHAIQQAVPEAADPDLIQVSAQGVLSMQELARRLHAIADELKTASASQAPAAASAGVWESLKSKAASLVSVRRLGEAETLDLVGRAGALMDQDSLAGAVQVLSSAEEPRPADIDAWLRDAQARLAAEKGSEELTARVLENLGSGS
jgi:hypothetical protein